MKTRTSLPLVISIATLLPLCSRSADLTWDPLPNPGIEAMDGPWTTNPTYPRWTADGGVTNVPWVNGNAAVFTSALSGRAYTMTLAESISASSLRALGEIRLSMGEHSLSVGMLAGHRAIFKHGSGVMTVSAEGSYNGLFVLEEGSLVLGDSRVFANAFLRIQPTGNVPFHSLGLHAFTFMNLGGTGNIYLGDELGVGVDLIIGNSGGYQNLYQGELYGPGSLTKDYGGSFTLAENNTYTGGTTVNGGTLELSGGGVDGTIFGEVVVNTGGTLRLSNTDAMGYGPNSVRAVNLNGGALHSSTTTNQTLAGVGITMTGGTISGTTNAKFDYLSGTTITTLASANQSTISARSHLRQPFLNFDVADGPAAVDLLISGPITEDLAGRGIIKSGPGTMVLSGTNTYTGGTTINEGALQLSKSTAGSSGPVTANAQGTLALAVPVTSPVTPTTAPIVLNGGTVGSIGAQTISSNVTVTAPSMVKIYNPLTEATGSDLIITGMLLGSSDLSLFSANGNTPDTAAFRLRGPVSTYSGTITVDRSAKFELQTSVTSGSPMGTGTLIVTGGGTTTTGAGTYSLVNVRNNSATSTVVSDVNFGNNVQVTGTGTSFFNMLGSAKAGSVSSFGDLVIGDGQAIGAVATGTASFTLAFSSVHLQGGTATFTPKPAGNTVFTSVQNIQLGAITEDIPLSGILMDGTSTLTLAAANHFTGVTKIQNGTTLLGAIGALPATADLIVNGGKLDLANLGVGFDQTVKSLSGSGGIITDTSSELHTLTVNQAATTAYSGAINGVVLTKAGSGTLALSGQLGLPILNVTAGTVDLNSSLISTMINNHGGTLNVNAKADNSTINVSAITNITVSQRLASLVIDSGGIATLGSAAPVPFGGGTEALPSSMHEFVSAEQEATATIPEPGSLSLLAFGVVGLLTRRRNGHCWR